MNRIGTAIVGNGMATRVFHAPYIRATAALELRAVVTREVADVLADPAIALVVIATPSSTHATLARQALLAGKHVVVEKPFALDVGEARDLVRLAAERGLMLTAFHNRRWDSDFLAVRAALDAGLIGPVVQFESRFDRFRPQVRDRWREDGSAGSGIWYDLGPHLLDQAVELFGMPEAVSADIAPLRPGSRAADYACVTLHYADKRAILQASMCVAGGSSRFAVHGLAGSLVKQALDPQEAQSVAGLTPEAAEWGVDPDPLIHIDEAGARRPIPAPRGCQQRFYALVAEAMREGGAPPAGAPVGVGSILGVQHLLDLAQQASRVGRRLPVAPSDQT